MQPLAPENAPWRSEEEFKICNNQARRAFEPEVLGFYALAAVVFHV